MSFGKISALDAIIVDMADDDGVPMSDTESVESWYDMELLEDESQDRMETEQQRSRTRKIDLFKSNVDYILQCYYNSSLNQKHVSKYTAILKNLFDPNSPFMTSHHRTATLRKAVGEIKTPKDLKTYMNQIRDKFETVFAYEVRHLDRY